MKKVAFIALILLLTALAAYRAAMSGYIRLNYPSFEKYPVHGIDVSHHQGTINWEEIEQEYVQFAFIKATEGATHQDSTFAINWQEAKKLDIPVSAYHFFTFCTKGAEQAENYINTVPYEESSLPPTIDLEYGGNCKQENRLPDLNREIADFIEIIENHYNRKVIIYTTREFYHNHVANNFPNNPIWIRNILSEPKLEDNRKWTFWQYTNRGRLNGISTPIDINLFVGGKEDFERLRTTRIQ